MRWREDGGALVGWSLPPIIGQPLDDMHRLSILRCWRGSWRWSVLVLRRLKLVGPVQVGLVSPPIQVKLQQGPLMEPTLDQWLIKHSTVYFLTLAWISDMAREGGAPGDARWGWMTPPSGPWPPTTPTCFLGLNFDEF